MAMVMPITTHLLRRDHLKLGRYMRIRKRTTGFSVSLISLPFKANVASTGTRVMARIAVPTMARLLVNARGIKSFPSIPLRAKTGINERIMITTEKNMGGPTTFEDSRTISLISSLTPILVLDPCLRVRFLKAFSIITMPASIKSPRAMAIPERDIMLEVMWRGYMNINDIRMARGRVTTITRALGKCMRKIPTIIRVIMASSSRVSYNVRMALCIKGVLS